MKHLVTFFWALLLMQMVNFVLNSLVGGDSLNLPKDSQLSYLDLGNKVKALLYDERGVTPEKIRNAKSAVYT
ncbi:DUF2929 family protein, partial [Staphylococcus aureus]|uniref:DUF2929 family protein n=1 Tax=Staphylococcus aureus TaxID=1280 RepID=UPI004057FA40